MDLGHADAVVPELGDLTLDRLLGRIGRATG
jgi:hypothetical protein